MRKIITTFGIAVAAVAGVAPQAHAAATGLKCFGTETGSTCVSNKDGSFTLSNSELGEYSGVYVPGKGLAGKPLSSVTALQFTYESTSAPIGGSPRFSLSIVGADGRDGYAFIDANSCNTSPEAPDSTGTVNPLTDPTCVVSGYFFNVDGSIDPFYYDSWNDFLNGEAGVKFFTNNSFIIIDADYVATVTLSDIKIGVSGKK